METLETDFWDTTNTFSVMGDEMGGRHDEDLLPATAQVNEGEAKEIERNGERLGRKRRWCVGRWRERRGDKAFVSRNYDGPWRIGISYCRSPVKDGRLRTPYRSNAW